MAEIYSLSSEEAKEKENMQLVPLLRSNPNQKGGLKTLPFIIVNESFEKVGSMGVMPNMILYLMNEYHLETTTGTYILNFYNSATNFFPIAGAFLADSLVGRFSTIGSGSVVSFLGMALLWSTSIIPNARPPPCGDRSSSTCSKATAFQLALLCSAFGLMSVGAGGMRGPSIAFGVDQITTRKDIMTKHKGILEKFYGWYYAASAFSIIIAYTFIVYIQEHAGWVAGFGVPVLLIFFSGLAFFLASHFYVKLQPKSSLLTGLVQVIVVSYKRRHLELPPKDTGAMYYYNKGSTYVIPSEKLRFLNKACLMRDPGQDCTHDEEVSNSWNLCTVDQVEELKALVKVIPIWLAGAIMSINVSQPSFGTLQAKSMDRHLTPGFEIPVGSFSMFSVAFILVWLILYDLVLIRLASAIVGRPVHLSSKQKMGLGILFSGFAMAVTAIVEGVRRREAIKEGYIDDTEAVVSMSAMWLIPQLCLLGFSEALNVVGQMEFYIGEFPKSMSSIASNVSSIGISLAALLASLLMNAVDQLTRRGGKTSWVSSNINGGHYDYFYWVLAGLSMVNFMYYCICSWAYGPCVEQGVNAKVIVEEGEEEENCQLI